MVRPRARRVAVALLVAGCVAMGACGTPDPEKANYLRVVVAIDSTIKVPDEIDAFKIVVIRDSATLFTGDFKQDEFAKLPDSLIIENPNPSNDSPDMQLINVKPIYVKLTGYAKGAPHLWRYARVQFNAGKRQIGLPMCRDCLDVPCEDGYTCIAGTCANWTLAPADSDEGSTINPLKECSP